MAKPYQPKDTGKLTNREYGTEKNRRDEEAITENGVQDMKQIRQKKK